MSAAAAAVLPSAPLVSVPAPCSDAFKQLKTRRTWQFLVYRIDEATLSLELVKSGAPSPSAVSELLRCLPPAEGRFCVFDLATKNTYGGSGNRIYLITWAPTSAGRGNVVYAAQRRALDKAFTGCIDGFASSSADIEALLKPTAAVEEGEWDCDA
jgi:cofilin